MPDSAYKFTVGTMRALGNFIAHPYVLHMEHIEERNESVARGEGWGVLALNHVSLADPILVGASLGHEVRVHALAKESLFRAPVLGRLMKAMDHIPVYRNSDRARDALSAAISAVRQGKMIALYPEGTVPKSADPFPAYKTGAARISIETGLPLIPAGQWGVQTALPAEGKRVRPLVRAIFQKPLHILSVGSPLFPAEGETPGELTARLKESIIRLTREARSVATGIPEEELA